MFAVLVSVVFGVSFFMQAMEQSKFIKKNIHYSDQLPIMQPERLDDRVARIVFIYSAQQERPSTILAQLPLDILSRYINKPVDAAGRTAIYYASTHEQVADLEEAGCRFDVSDAVENNDPLQYAIKYGKKELALALVSSVKGWGVPDIFGAYGYQVIERIARCKLTDLGADDFELTKSYIRTCIEKDSFWKPARFYRNKLFYARDSAHIEELCQESIDPNAQDIWGNTPLIFALKDMRPELVPDLLALGADPSMCDHVGRNALSYVVIMRYNHLISSLITKCFYVECDIHDYSLLDLAARYNTHGLVLLLDEYFRNNHYMSFEQDHTQEDLCKALKIAEEYNEEAVAIVRAAGAGSN